MSRGLFAYARKPFLTIPRIPRVPRFFIPTHAAYRARQVIIFKIPKQRGFSVRVPDAEVNRRDATNAEIRTYRFLCAHRVSALYSRLELQSSFPHGPLLLMV
jgi:hypothetical protein